MRRRYTRSSSVAQTILAVEVIYPKTRAYAVVLGYYVFSFVSIKTAPMYRGCFVGDYDIAGPGFAPGSQGSSAHWLSPENGLSHHPFSSGKWMLPL